MQSIQVLGTVILSVSCVLANAFPFASDLVFNFNGLPKQLQFTLKSSIPRDYILFEDSYYKYHRGPQKWSKARQICEFEGGHLAIINSEDEASFLLGIMNKYPNEVLKDVMHKDYILLGFHGYFKEGEYVTVDGKSIESTGYFHWAPGQPDNIGKENCGSLHRQGGLNDFECHVPAPFICEIPQAQTCNLTVPPEAEHKPPPFDLRGSVPRKH